MVLFKYILFRKNFWYLHQFIEVYKACQYMVGKVVIYCTAFIKDGRIRK